jgi:hypothetical protein
MGKATVGTTALALLVAGCSQGRPPEGEPRREESAARAPATQAASPSANAVAADPDRISRYTRLDACRVAKTNPDEGGWSISDCPGVAGYGLRLSEDDLRQDLAITPPGGGERSLALGEATKTGGFSRLGETAEWRGVEQGGSFRPDAIILRYLVVENPDAPGKETSYLLAVSLAGAKPCVTAKLAPGPGQNERARQMADRPGKCLV